MDSITTNEYKNFLECCNSIFTYRKEEESTTIYHYTSPDGLLAIVKNGTLRFSDRLCLNDASEGKYTLDLIVNHFKQIIDNNHPLALLENRIIEDCKSFREKISTERFKIYQVSFSIDSDSLCLWNYYTKGNDIKGYNIQFDSLDLIKKLTLNSTDITKSPHILNHRVIYKYDEQINEIKMMFYNFYNAILADNNNIQDNALKDFKKYFLSVIVQRLYLLGIFFKPYCFHIENEYRIAIDVNDCNGSSPNLDAKKQYTYKKDMFVPAYDIKFDLSAIKSITISPTVNFSDSKKTLESMLNDKGIYNATINQSEIPVRF